MIRVRVVDDHALVREGLALILGAQPDIDVLGAHADGAELLAALDADTDVVLLDLYLPGMDGIEVLQRIQREWAAKVVMLTTIGRAGKSGARWPRARADSCSRTAPAPNSRPRSARRTKASPR
ncbi:response regulator transcription factor [Amycolatopsis sp. WGS_07]|uniref:response regulator n=1 Tax=Amycolatopsis sp. WGS_07 TaxID=3076764 RepID=UPI003873240A